MRILVCLALLLLSSPALGQGGWVTEKHPDLGLTFPRARTYEQIPTPPDESHIVLYFAEKVPEKAKERKEFRPELNVVWIEKTPEASKGGGTGPEKASGKTRPINSLGRYVDRMLPKWKLGTAVVGKTRDGKVGSEYSLTPGPEMRDPRAAWVYAYADDQRTIAFLGLCHEKDLKDQVKIWRHTAEGVEFAEPEESSAGHLERMYAKLGLPDPEYRIAVRRKLVRGWKAEDTEHYIVIYNTTDQPLVKKIVRDLELLNAEYCKLFPPTEKVDAVSTVRICKDRDEYLSFGGVEWGVGYWSWPTEELVLYDAERVERNVKIDADTFETLYHEAFHQYIHYACGQLAPHSWFNEGHGEYFAGARVKDGKVRAIEVLPAALHGIDWAIANNRFVPWKEMIRYEQSQYYAPDMAAICYAQGWSMIFFLRRCKDVEERPEWARIIPTYFETLGTAYRGALTGQTEGGKGAGRVARVKAELEARSAAVEAAFRGVDLAELEAAWIEFVRELAASKDR